MEYYLQNVLDRNGRAKWWLDAIGNGAVQSACSEDVVQLLELLPAEADFLRVVACPLDNLSNEHLFLRLKISDEEY